MTFVIGHAGAAGEAPANTLAGVRSALHAGCDAMEIDVQLSLEGVPVLMHDTKVDRTTNLRGAVRSIPLADLHAADAGQGEPVPTLAEVLDLVRGQLTVMCELKPDPALPRPERPLVEAVLAVLRAHGAEPWSAIHSFDVQVVGCARQVAPEFSAAVISPRVQRRQHDRLFQAVLRQNAQAVSVDHAAIDREFVRRAKQHQLTVWAWTADEPSDWQRLVDAGADGIITNRPHALAAILRG